MIKTFFYRLGCLAWTVLYLSAGFFVGRLAYSALPFGPSAFKTTIGVLCGIFLFVVLCIITLLVMIATDKDYDNPQPFSIKPLPKKVKVPSSKRVDRSGAL